MVQAQAQAKTDLVPTRGEGQDQIPAVDKTISRIGSSELSDIDISAKTRVWAALERLTTHPASDSAEALKEVQLLLNLANLETGREAIVRALRTEEPAHFSYTEVRAEAFKAIAAHIQESGVFPVFMEEIENNQNRKESCRVVIEALNASAAFGDQYQIDRIYKLITNFGIGSGEAAALGSLAPTIALRPSEEVLEHLRSRLKEQYQNGRSAAQSVFNALAISGDPESVALLRKIAIQDFFSRRTDLFHALLGGAIFVGATVAGVGFGLLVGHPIAFGVLAGLGGLISGIVSVVKNLSYSEWNGREYLERRRISNIDMAAKAIRAFEYVPASAEARDAISIVLKGNSAADVVEAARELNGKLELPLNIGDLIDGIKHEDPRVRIRALEGLAKLDSKKARSAIESKISDTNLEVRRLAYKLLDRQT